MKLMDSVLSAEYHHWCDAVVGFRPQGNIERDFIGLRQFYKLNTGLSDSSRLAFVGHRHRPQSHRGLPHFLFSLLFISMLLVDNNKKHTIMICLFF